MSVVGVCVYDIAGFDLLCRGRRSLDSWYLFSPV